MNIDEIKYLTSRFRRGAEIAHSKGKFEEQPFNDFPNACCGDAPWLVAQYLLEHYQEASVRYRYVYGSYMHDSFEHIYGHAWLEVIWPELKKKVIVDIASDQRQFRNTDIFPLCASVPYYVGGRNAFYSLFEVYSSQCRWVYGLDEIMGEEGARMRDLYKKIVQYIPE